MRKLSSFVVFAGVAAIVACNKKDQVVVVPPSEGETLTLDGGSGGANAVNSVYIDLSSGVATPVARTSWDLGFYNGSEFRVILNNTTSAGAKVLTATNLADVTAADTIGLTLAVAQASPSASDYAYFDPIDGSLSATVIPAVSATASENKVVVINRGTGGGVAARPWIKVKITRNSSGGYTLQYGRITETTNFQTVNISKDASYHFQYVSFDNGAVVNVQPKKTDWDLTWGYSIYQTNFGTGLVPYGFSDLVAINHLSGVQVVERKYASADARNAAYTAFNRDSVSNYNSAFVSGRWAIGSSWRITPAPNVTNAGVTTDRFYLIKDVAGNFYKLKFISFVANDGGERGKPVFEYKLIQ